MHYKWRYYISWVITVTRILLVNPSNALISVTTWPRLERYNFLLQQQQQVLLLLLLLLFLLFDCSVWCRTLNIFEMWLITCKYVDLCRSRLYFNHVAQLFVINFSPWSRGLPAKLTGPQLMKKFATFFGTGSFISVFHVCLSRVRSNHSVPPNPLLDDPFHYHRPI